MRIMLVNMSKRPEMTAAVVQRIAHAIESQVCEDYAPFWQAACVPVTVAADVAHLPSNTSPIVILDAPDQSGAEGWHSYKDNFGSYGEVFTDTVLDHGGTLFEGSNSVSVLLSHEVLETIEDPYVNWLVQVDDNLLEWREVCDRVEADSYDKEGCAVSNFLGPRAFRQGPGPYDFMGLLTEPFEVRPGGYVQRWDVTTNKLVTTWGPDYPDHRKTRKRRRRAIREKFARSFLLVEDEPIPPSR